MTLENCIKYLEEAEDEEIKKFWTDRINRKYPDALKKPEPVKKVKKVEVKNGSSGRSSSEGE